MAILSGGLYRIRPKLGGQRKSAFVADLVVWDHDLRSSNLDGMVNDAPRDTICGGQFAYAA
jgi:hypothetical protein